MEGRATHDGTARYLGVDDAVDGAGGSEVEDARTAPRGGEEGGVIEEVAPEDAEAALAGASGERVEVVRLGLVICTSTRRQQQDNCSLRNARNYSSRHAIVAASKTVAVPAILQGHSCADKRICSGGECTATDRG